MSRRLVSSGARPWAVACALVLSYGVSLGEGEAVEPEQKKPEGKALAEAISEEVRAVFCKSRDAIVRIEGSDKNGMLCGSGFFIDPNGTLLTSYSIGGESEDLVVTMGEARYPARRLVADARSGVALLKIEAPSSEKPHVRFLPLAKKADLEIASPVMVVAYPMNRPVTPSLGVVAGFDLSLNNRYFATTHLRVNIPVHRGGGGAPLLNMRGDVVGVVISGLDGGSACYSLPIEAVWKIYHDYVRYGEVRPGWLGIVVAESTKGARGGSTAEVAGIEEDGPAVKSGLEIGDILQKIGECEVKAPEDVINASFYLSQGEKVKVNVLRRGHEALEIDIVPIERPEIGKKRGKRLGIPFGSEDITIRGVQ